MMCSWSCKPPGVEPRWQGGSCTKLAPFPRGSHTGHLFDGFKKPPVLGADFLRLGKRAGTLCIETAEVVLNPRDVAFEIRLQQVGIGQPADQGGLLPGAEAQLPEGHGVCR